MCVNGLPPNKFYDIIDTTIDILAIGYKDHVDMPEAVGQAARPTASALECGNRAT